MIKLFYIIIIPLTFISFLIIAEPARAATEFVSTIKQSGGNYSTFASWEAAIQSDLTASTTAVYSGTGTGSLSQGNILELFRGGTYQNATSTLIATTSTQILVQNYYNSGAPITLQSGDEWRKASSTANMFTVSGSGVQLGDTPIATAQIDGAWTSPDTTAVTINGWTTDATHYIKIYTTTAARHNGKWDTGKYRLEVAVSSNSVVNVYEEFVRIEGIQIGGAFSGSGSGIAIQNTVSVASSDIRLSNNIIKATSVSGNYNRGIGINGGINKIWNNLIYDLSGVNDYGINSNNNVAAFSYIYNNTIINTTNGIIRSSNNQTFVVKNNIVQGATDGYYQEGSGSDYNISNVASDAIGANSKNLTTVPFVDATNKDFHLSSSDTFAKDAGANLSADLNLAFSDDIDGNTRPIGSAWDIGADETYGVIIIIE